MTIAIISRTHHRVLYGDGDVVLAGHGGDGDGGGALHLQPQLARPQVGGLGLDPAQGGVCNTHTSSTHNFFKHTSQVFVFVTLQTDF